MNASTAQLEANLLAAVPPARGLRRFALVLGVVFAILPPALVVVPWQQNVQAHGRVTALDPRERTQVLPAPVTGRLVELLVQEGTVVEEGQVIARMEDQDPQYAMRLQQQLELTREKVRAAQDMVAFYDQQRAFLEEARDQAMSSARFDYNVAVENVRVTERELEALQAELAQKSADWARKGTLWEAGVVSELDYQKAEADYLAAQAKVEAAKSKVEQARNTERSKEAEMARVASDQQAKIESIKSSREEARTKAALAEKDLADATTKLERQKTQVITAPRAGTVLRIHAASSTDFLVQGQPLMELIPAAQELVVELWVRGVDAPLIRPGRRARLQFEGWPAVQFAGWPSVAVGTFGAEVLFVDAQGDASGRFRVVLRPDPEDEPWPDRTYLRQGVRVNGWILLDTVSVGYEIWRNLNSFPPSVRDVPEGGGGPSKDAAGGTEGRANGGPASKGRGRK